MPIPRVAIVGRPNVGKSSLLNMIAREKVSIVDPTAGTTRDRVSIIADLLPPDHGPDSRDRLSVEVTDTGGFGVYVEDGRRFDDVGRDLSNLTDDIEFQISQAVAGADLVLFVIDAQAGITAADMRVAKLLRERVLGKRGVQKRTPKPAVVSDPASSGAQTQAEPEPESAPEHEVHIRVVGNKCDGPKWEAHAYEAAGLGFGEPLLVSAKNNYFRRDFLEELYREIVKLPSTLLGERQEPAELKIAIVGKRNAGKSSLVNALAGGPRVIVSEIAGTTRDAVDVRVNMDGHEFIVIDTAGLRKKKSFADRIEWWAYDRAQRSIERADVVIMLVDAADPLSQVDQHLMKLVQISHKPCVICVNKWDLADGKPAGSDGAGAGRKWRKGDAVNAGMYRDYLHQETKGLEFAPLAFVSAKNKTNLKQLIKLAFDLHRQSGQRISTGKLNRLIREVLSTRGPSSKLGTFVKVLFTSQVAVHPPTIVLVVNRPELFTPNYQRFLMNRLREQVSYAEVPIKLIVKERKRARIEDLLTGEYQRLKEAGAKVVADAISPGELKFDESSFENGGAFDDSDLSTGSSAAGAGSQPSAKPGARPKPIVHEGFDGLEDDLDDEDELADKTSKGAMDVDAEDDDGDGEPVEILRPATRGKPIDDVLEEDFSVEELPSDASSYFDDHVAAESVIVKAPVPVAAAPGAPAGPKSNRNAGPKQKAQKAKADRAKSSRPARPTRPVSRPRASSPAVQSTTPSTGFIKPKAKPAAPVSRGKRAARPTGAKRSPAVSKSAAGSSGAASKSKSLSKSKAAPSKKPVARANPAKTLATSKRPPITAKPKAGKPKPMAKRR